LAADCKSKNGNRCLKKSEIPSFGSMMLGGDPCFMHNGARWCFVSNQGTLNPCDCTPECGCSDKVPVAPKCDNSAVPKNPDCTADKNTYCKLDYQGQKNTRCTYCGVNVAACNKLCERTLSDADIKVIVDKHNELRRKVAKGQETRGVGGGQPKAADMYELVWDADLAASAQRWADQCPNAHDKNRLIPAFTYVGQNMADSWSSVNSPERDLAGKVNGWYEEVVGWPAANLAKFDQTGAKGVTGHYTQLIWGATTKVGCGYVSYVDPAAPDYPYRQTLICNYGIGGNMMGSKVYTATTGAPGSGCPKGANDGLCKQ
jgi:hypothetical protein